MTDCLGVVWSTIPLSAEYGHLLAVGVGREISEVLTSASSDSEVGRDNVLSPILDSRFGGPCRGWSVMDCLEIAWFGLLSTNW